MSQYILVYIGGNHPETPEEGQKHFTKYQAWLSSLGQAVVSPANPFKNTHQVDSCGEVSEGSSTGMSGYTIVEAETMEDALAMAKTCPFLEIEGKLEVSELISMSM